jgi:predicted phosphodiesterase
MNYLVISDIHGSAEAVRRALAHGDALGADRILILGDVLYHGPRNPIPPGYDPQGVVALLNPLSDRIAAVRGNCEAEVDQMLLDFACMGDYLLMEREGATFLRPTATSIRPMPCRSW